MSAAMNKTRIRQIISRQLITVTPETPLVEAVAIMADARISCLVVVEGKRPLGIFTERDLVRLAHRQTPFISRSIGDVMTTPVVTIPGTLSIYEAYSLMLTNKIRHHVVVDSGGKLLGLMTQSDLINHLGHEYFMEMRKIDQVMTRNVVTITADLPINKALAAMSGPGISCVIIVEQECPLGILTERDVVRLVAAGVALADAPVAGVMNSPVRTVKVGATIHKVAQLMKKEHIRRVVVVDEHGRIAGIITQTDIIKGLEGKYIELLKEIIREKEDVFRQTARELLDKTVYLDNILSSAINMAIVATDDALRIKYFNPVAETVFNCRSAALNGRCALELLALEDIAPLTLNQAREIVLREGKCLFPAEIKRNGVPLYYDGTLSGILNKQGQLVGFVLMLNDVTERRRYEDTIHHMAYHDTLGHSMGDLLLKSVGERLKGLMRKSDTVSRMGGDEFVLLLASIASSESAVVTAAKIVTAFRVPFVCNGHTLNVTASIGIADFPDDGEDAESLLKNADIALYRVKEQGRDNYQRYSMVSGR